MSKLSLFVPTFDKKQFFYWQCLQLAVLGLCKGCSLPGPDDSKEGCFKDVDCFELGLSFGFAEKM